MTLKTESAEFYRALGLRIELYRKWKGLGQGQLGRAIGVTQQTIFAYESGTRRVPVSALVRIAAELSTTVERLIYADERMVSKRGAHQFERAAARHE